MILSLRTYLLVALLLLAATVATWSGMFSPIWWRLPLAFVLLAVAAEGFLARVGRMQVHRVLPPVVALGAPVACAVTLSNATGRGLALDLRMFWGPAFAGPDEVVRVQLPARGQVTLVRSIIPQRLGPAALPALYARTRGPFGLAWWPEQWADGAVVPVVPARLPAGALRVATVREGRVPVAPPGSGDELRALRDGRMGDPFRAVDWKATARRGQLTVREYTQTQHLEVLLLLDVGQSSSVQAGTLARVGHYANIAARLAEYVVGHGDAAGLGLFAGAPVAGIAPAAGARGLAAVRGLLEHLPPAHGESNLLAVAAWANALLKRRALVVFLTEMDEGVDRGQLARAVRLLRPKHLPVIATLQDPETAALADRPARSRLDPYIAYAAAESARSCTRTVQALARLGCAVIREPEGRLDAALLNHYGRMRARHRV